jgi:hypothetical protein
MLCAGRVGSHEAGQLEYAHADDHAGDEEDPVGY